MEIIEVGRCFQIDGRKVCGTLSCKLSNGKVVPTRRVTLNYVCERCEHGLVEYVDSVRCPECESVHIISRDALRKQQVAAVEVLQGLPKFLQHAATRRPTDTAAIDALWGMGAAIDTQNEKPSATVERFMREKKLFKQEKRNGN